MNQQAMSSVLFERISPVVGSYTSTPRISMTYFPSFCGSSFPVFVSTGATSGSPNTMNRLAAPVFFSSSSPIERSGFIKAGRTTSLP